MLWDPKVQKVIKTLWVIVAAILIVGMVVMYLPF